MNKNVDMGGNTNVIGKLDGISIVCDTPAGSAFVKKICHPPTTLPSEYLGTPDASAPNVVLVEMKGETNIPPIWSYYEGTAPAPVKKDMNTTSMLFLTSSGIQSATYVFLRYNGGWIQPHNSLVEATAPFINKQITPCGATNQGYNIHNLVNDASMMRTTYKSNTFYLNATDFNNQGTVTTAKFKPKVITFESLPALFRTMDSPIDKLKFLCDQKLSKRLEHPFDRYHIIGHTKEVNDTEFEIIGNRKSSNRRVVSISVAEIDDIAAEFDYRFQILEMSPTTDAAYDAITGIDNLGVLYNILPNTPSDILNLSPKACTRPAKEGAFVVQQNIDPIAFWHDTPSERRDGSYNYDLVESYIRCFNSTTNAYVYIPLYASNTNEFLNTVPYSITKFTVDAPWNNLDFSWTIFDGITIPSTVGTSLSSVPYITVKSYVGCELQASFNGSLESFQRLLPLPDVKAVQVAAGIFHARPDSLPASANDLGTIMATVATYVPQVIGWLKDVFGGSKKDNTVKSVVKRVINKRAPKPTSNKPIKEDKKLINTIKNLENKINKMSVKQTSTLPTYQATNVKMPGAPKRFNRTSKKMLSRRPPVPGYENYQPKQFRQ